MKSKSLRGWRLYAINFFLLLISSLSTIALNAQSVKGTVTDQNGSGIPNVTVTVKGTTAGTKTDDAGNFSITARKGDILNFSSVGFVTKEVAVSDEGAVIKLILNTNARDLGEVVVTALGISKQSRGLGYAASNVKPDELTINRTPNPMNALQGKVAGVNISSLGTGPGGSSKIRIRGQSSLSGQNGPLIVINGVPVDNTNFNESTSSGIRGGGVTADGGDGLSSINPDDIESMTILKGAPAAALYGSRAQNGVIMVTTKTKGKTKGIGLSYNFNFTSETPLDFTDYQTEYGQGENGVRPTTPNPTSGQWSFGEKITPGLTHTLFNTPNLPYVAQGSRIKEFYRTGTNMAHTVTFSATGEKGGLHLSLNSTDNKGIVPNNRFAKKGLNLGYSYNLSPKLSFAGSINYTNELNYNPPNIANQDNTIPTTLMAMANTMPLSVLNANKYDPATGDEYRYSRFTNRTNPYWILAEQFHNIRRDRIFGNISVKYNLLPWLYVQGRFGQDFSSRDEEVNNFPTGQTSRALVPGFANGIYTQEARRFRETNMDILISANKKFGNFDATLTAGGNQMRQRLDINNIQVTDFFVRGLYTVQNGRAKDPIYTLITKGVNSVYGSGEISWNKVFYLSGTIRDDAFSTLSPANRHVLYPSVSGSYVLSEHLSKVWWLDFAKLRVGYAEVGSDNSVDAFSDQLFYAVAANLPTNSANTPVPLATSGNSIPNPDLVPSRTAETEAGLEVRLLNNKINFEVSVYKKVTSDQIVSVQVSDASGFLTKRINSGKSQNKGFEAVLGITPVKTKNFTWNFTANTSYNKTKVLSILTNTPGERITTGTHVFNGETRHVVGQEMGQIAGFGYQRDATKNNQRVFQSNGLPLRTSGLVLFGSALPKWTGGFLNSFNYKGLSLSIFIDYKLGGKMLSGTNFNAVRHGLHKVTLEGRATGVVGQGVTQSGAVNTTSAAAQFYWEHLRTQQIVESVIYDAGYWKLRQVSLGYDLTKFIPAKWPVKGLRLDFVANNVLMLKKWVDNIDPETFGFGSDNNVGLENPGLPTTRGIGFNLNVKF
ncbi:MAG: SusC/RagA family TonB-linked outer membrane protein [Flavihumibacter sp.]|nr:SusC/RagA family TonB-linked outer membrane protein [Flavihumibacter sp.]